MNDFELQSGRGRLPAILAAIIPPLLYLALIVPIGWQQRLQINPDGIIYLRKAQMLLAGHVMDSISGYWPPGLSWCIALVLKLRPLADPINVIHGVLGFWGFVWVCASVTFLYTVVPRQPWARLVSGIALAFVAVRVAIVWMAPDLLLCSFLLAYLSCLNWPKQRAWMPFAAGVLAGLGYLCKAYAMPFFVLHYVATIAYRYWTKKPRPNWRMPLILGFCGLALSVIPWASVLSYKYGKFTISMVYHHNHLNVAPNAWLRSTPDFCVVPPPQYLCIWEGLDPGPRIDWSPWASASLFRHQVAIALTHVLQIVVEVWTFDRIALVIVIAIITLLPAKLAWKRARDIQSVWLVLTGAIYCLGFLAVAFETRYVVPFLLPIGIGLCFSEARRFELRWGAIASAAVFLIVAAIALWPYMFVDGPRGIYRSVAEAMLEKHFDGPFTSSENNSGVDVAYYLNRQIVLLPAQADFKGKEADDMRVIESKLQAAHVKYLLLWTDIRTARTDLLPRELSQAMKKTQHWELVYKMKLDRAREVFIYHWLKNTDVG